MKGALEKVLELQSDDFMIGIKVNGEDKYIDFIEWCAERLDLIELSTGNFEKRDRLFYNFKEKYSSGFLLRHRELMSHRARIVPTGGFASKADAWEFMEREGIPMVGFGRLYCLPEP